MHVQYFALINLNLKQFCAKASFSRILPASNSPWFSLHIVTTAILRPSPRLRPCITVAPGLRDPTPDVFITQHLTSLGTNFTQTQDRRGFHNDRLKILTRSPSPSPSPKSKPQIYRVKVKKRKGIWHSGLSWNSFWDKLVTWGLFDSYFMSKKSSFLDSYCERPCIIVMTHLHFWKHSMEWKVVNHSDKKTRQLL